ncbi:hypothetical protein [Aeromonas hydrophila]|uniref:hypothetical protein n=1 Tax=Aeromonas hydrophila TaxID=644 RepID=UPI00114C9D7F|nr:hypothetical protein [Aeromonas hydrophila]
MSHPIEEKNNLEYIRVYIKLLIDALKQSPKNPQRLMNRIEGAIVFTNQHSDTPDNNIIKSLTSAKLSKTVDSTIHFLERALIDIEEKQKINNEVFHLIFKIISYFITSEQKTATSFTIKVCDSDTKKSSELITLAIKYGYLDFSTPDDDSMLVTAKGLELYRSFKKQLSSSYQEEKES